MGPKSKKKSFKPVNLDELKQKDEKSRKNELNSNITQNSQNDPGNHRGKDVLHTTEKVYNEAVKRGTNSTESARELLTENTDKSTGAYSNTSLEDNIQSETSTFRSYESNAGGNNVPLVEEKSDETSNYQLNKNRSFSQSVSETQYTKNFEDDTTVKNTRTENQRHQYNNKGKSSPQNEATYNQEFTGKKYTKSFKQDNNRSSLELTDNKGSHFNRQRDDYTRNRGPAQDGDYNKSQSSRRSTSNTIYHSKNQSSNYWNNRKDNTNRMETSKGAYQGRNESSDGNQTVYNENWRVAENNSREVSLKDDCNDSGDWNDSGNAEGKDNFWDYNNDSKESKKQFYQKTKSGSGYRKSESFVYDRRENKDFSRRSDSSFSRPFLPQDFFDPEYQEFYKEIGESENVIFKKVKEIEEDLFNMAEDYALGHCVAADMRMGSGIAVKFKKQFGNLGKLLSQNQKAGGLAILVHESKVSKRTIYYLVTKQLSNGKPTYGQFWTSLKKMRDHIRDNDIKKLAIPKIGCGLDRLEWSIVKNMIEFLFRDVDVEITVCNFQQSEDVPSLKDSSCKVVYDENPVAKIDIGTIIIYFSTETGEIEEDTLELANKFKFLDQLKKATRRLGDAIRFEDRSKNYILYGCIVKKTRNSPFDFQSFAKCISQIKKDNKKDLFGYIAYQSITDKNDFIINDKIITLLRNLMRDVEVYVCKSDKVNLSNLEE